MTTDSSLNSEVDADERQASTAEGVETGAARPLEESGEWLAYVASPNGALAGALVAAMPVEIRGAIVEAVERLFFEKGDWRVAQHAAFLHLDRFEPHADQPDLVKALCFAQHACSGSKDHPRARLVMGLLNWERRLPLAVLYDVETARAGETRLRSEVSGVVVDSVLGQASLLEGMARAYLRDVNRAQECLSQAANRGALTVEAVIQLLLAADPDFHEASMWASERLPVGIVLVGRPAALQQRADRLRLISLLRTRGGDVRS